MKELLTRSLDILNRSTKGQPNAKYYFIEEESCETFGADQCNEFGLKILVSTNPIAYNLNQEEVLVHHKSKQAVTELSKVAFKFVVRNSKNPILKEMIEYAYKIACMNIIQTAITQTDTVQS